MGPHAGATRAGGAEAEGTGRRALGSNAKPATCLQFASPWGGSPSPGPRASGGADLMDRTENRFRDQVFGLFISSLLTEGTAPRMLAARPTRAAH